MAAVVMAGCTFGQVNIQMVRGAALLEYLTQSATPCQCAPAPAQAVKSMANVIVCCTEREAENLAAFMLVLLKAIEAWRVRLARRSKLPCARW